MEENIQAGGTNVPRPQGSKEWSMLGHQMGRPVWASAMSGKRVVGDNITGVAEA